MKRFKGRIVIIVLFISVLFAYLSFLQYDSFSNDYKDFNNQLLKGYRNKLNVIQYTYNINSNTYFNESINNDKILEIMYRANNASLEEQKVLRSELHKLVIESYDNQTLYGYRQVHFHLIDNTSFLRMHKVEKYGDDLTDIRESVRLANLNQEYVEGFEEGKVLNGYRYVFPLFYNGQHVGSVETSISLQAVSELFYNYYNDISAFIIRKEVVNEKVFVDEKTNFLESDISKDYYYDKEILEYNNSIISAELEKEIDKINSELYTQYQDQINSGDEFYITSLALSRTIFFLPISNFKNEHVGYMIFYNNQYPLIYSVDDIVQKLDLSFLAWLIITVFIIYLNKSRSKFIILTKKDKLTGCFNRYAIDDIFNKEFSLYKRYYTPFSFVMFDIDHFKKVNDTFGHLSGDAVLKGIARIVRENTRTNDTFIRWGGEEFIIILPQTNLEEATNYSEKIRRAIEKQHFIKGHNKSITVSFGVTSFRENDTFDKVTKRLDENLYKAKNSGRNNVVSSL